MTQNSTVRQLLDQMSGSLQMTQTRCGPMLVYNNDTIVSQALILLGEYSHGEIQVMSQYLNADSLYVDVGTNVGYHARAVNHAVGCRVVAFEPQPKHFAIAAYNAQGKNIKVYQAACGNQNGTVHIQDVDPEQQGNYGEAQLSDSGIEVSCVMLDSIPDLDERCDVIKIDVEGFELEVLQGAQSRIRQHRPVVFFEALEHSRWDQCRQFLQERDYGLYWATVMVYPDAGTFKTPEQHPFGRIGAFNILAVPLERAQPQHMVPVQAGEWYRGMVQRMTSYQLVV